VAESKAYSLDLDHEGVAGESDLVVAVVEVRKVDDPNFPFLKVNIRQMKSVQVVSLSLYYISIKP
jgi:hypothetical protein